MIEGRRRREGRERGEGRGGREGRGGLPGNVAEEAFCLKSAPDHTLNGAGCESFHRHIIKPIGHKS